MYIFNYLPINICVYLIHTHICVYYICYIYTWKMMTIFKNEVGGPHHLPYIEEVADLAGIYFVIFSFINRIDGNIFNLTLSTK